MCAAFGRFRHQIQGAEALSADMPLVYTPLSIEGLELENEKHLLLGDEDEELASALMRLLEQSHLVKEITRQGHEWVQQRYAWDVILAPCG